MKNLIFLSLIVMLATSCNKITHARFYADFKQSGTIPHQSAVGVTVEVMSPAITTGIDQKLKDNNTSPDLVQSVKLDSMSLVVTAPAGQSLDFLSDARILISTEGQPEVEVAYKHNITVTGTSLNMDIDDTELKPYLTASHIYLKIIATNSKVISQDVTLEARMKFRFEVNLLKVL